MPTDATSTTYPAPPWAVVTHVVQARAWPQVRTRVCATACIHCLVAADIYFEDQIAHGSTLAREAEGRDQRARRRNPARYRTPRTRVDNWAWLDSVYVVFNELLFA